MGASLQQQNRQCIIISLEELSLEEKVNVLVLAYQQQFVLS